MNRETYNELTNTINHFDNRYTEMIKMDDIIFDDLNSQVRQLGHVHAKVPAMTQALANGAKLPPISLRKLANGKSELKDGATRYLAHRNAGLDTIFATHYHDSVGNPNADEWFDIQCSQNDHPVSTPNSEADIESQISRRVNKGIFEKKAGFKYADDPEQFIIDSVAYLETIYKNSGLSARKLKNILKKCLTGTITTLFQSYSKDTAMDLIKSVNDFGWSTSKRAPDSIGEICNNVCFYPCATYPQLKTNAFANGGYKKIDNPNIDIYIVYYMGDLAGQTEKKIKDSRNHIEEEYDKINNAFTDANGNKIFSGLYFLPQIKTGQNKEDLYQLIKVR